MGLPKYLFCLQPTSNKWGSITSFIYYVLVRCFVIVLILFVLAIWVLVQGDNSSGWVSWIDFKAVIIPTSIIIGCVQCLAIFFFVFRHRHQTKTEFRGIQEAGWQNFWHGQSFLGSVTRDILRLLIFEWLVFNTTSLFVALSSIGLPSVEYNFDPALIVTITSGGLQYAAFILYYIKRHSVITWNLTHTFTVLLPLSCVLFGSAIVFLVNYIHYPYQVEIRNWFLTTCAVLFGTTICVPAVIHFLILRPFKRRIATRQLDRLLAPLTVMERAVIRKCRHDNITVEEVESLMLIGLNIDTIRGLEDATKLKRLYLSCNKISSTHGLETLGSLELLDLRNNEISSFHDLVPLRSLPNLKSLSLEQNPLIANPELYLALLPGLERINGQHVTQTMREKAIADNKGWLTLLLSNYQKTVFDARMKLVGGQLHEYTFNWSVTAPLDSQVRRGSGIPFRRKIEELNFYLDLAHLRREKEFLDLTIEGVLPAAVPDSNASWNWVSPLYTLRSCFRLRNLLGEELSGPSRHSDVLEDLEAPNIPHIDVSLLEVEVERPIPSSSRRTGSLSSFSRSDEKTIVLDPKHHHPVFHKTKQTKVEPPMRFESNLLIV